MRGVERAVVVLPLAIAVAHAVPATALTRPGRIVFPAMTRVDGVDGVALTFDDGPDAALDRFLLALDRAGARATFFVTGEQVALAPRRVAEIVAAGHEVGVHGYRHRNHLRLAPFQVTDDLRRAGAEIENAAGCTTTVFRPPYGIFSLASWREAGHQGWRRVLWSRWGRDWEARATSRSIVDRVGWPDAGDIILLHDSDRYSARDSWRRTLDALPLLFERLTASGLKACSVSELVERSRLAGMGPDERRMRMQQPSS